VTRQIQLAPAASAPRRGSEYAELSRQVKQAGLLERRSAYYAWKIPVTIPKGLGCGLTASLTWIRPAGHIPPGIRHRKPAAVTHGIPVYRCRAVRGPCCTSYRN
jgi:hypothetical protein